MLLYDLACTPDNRPSHERWFMTGDDFRDERHVIKSLRRRGHIVEPFGLFDDVNPLLKKLSTMTPDIVFNMCESFSGRRRHEADVMSLLELLGVAHTGASAETLNICKDKALSKKIVSFHGVSIPKFAVLQSKTNSYRESVLKRNLLSHIPWPAICKPLDRDSSEGISMASIVRNPDACTRQVERLEKKFTSGIIVEEFIAGREIYVGMMELPGRKNLVVLPPRELYTGTGPGFVTWRAKWDKAFRRLHNIDSGKAKKIAPATIRRIENVARESYLALGLSGYARLDLRLRENGDPVFLEANPNPSIRRGDDFALAAQAAGIDYDDLIEAIVRTAIVRHAQLRKSA